MVVVGDGHIVRRLLDGRLCILLGVAKDVSLGSLLESRGLTRDNLMATPTPAKRIIERSLMPSPQAMRLSRVRPLLSSRLPRLTSLATPSGTASMKKGLDGRG